MQTSVDAAFSSFSGQSGVV